MRNWMILSMLTFSLVACQQEEKAEGASETENPEMAKLKEENDK